MSAGIGMSADIGYGSPDSWQGAPMNGVDLETHIAGGDIRKSLSARIPEDTWLAIVLILALVGLWVLGGFVFKNARL